MKTIVNKFNISADLKKFYSPDISARGFLKSLLPSLLIYLYRINNYDNYSLKLYKYAPSISVAQKTESFSLPLKINFSPHDKGYEAIFKIQQAFNYIEDNYEHKNVYNNLVELSEETDNTDVILAFDDDVFLNLPTLQTFKYLIVVKVAEKAITFYSSSAICYLIPRCFEQHLRNLIELLKMHGDISLSKLYFLENKELMWLKAISNTSYTDDSSITLGDAFQSIVEQYPQRKAVSQGSDYLTYKALSKKVDAISDFLLNQCPVQLLATKNVVIYIKNQFEFVAAMLAVSKTKNTYVPIDTDFPDNYVSSLIDSIPVDYVITKEKHRPVFENITHLSIICVDNIKQTEQTLSLNDKKVRLKGLKNPYANIMFTSGTTGKPKGMLIKQASIMRLVKNPNYIDIKPQDIVAQTSSVAFDASTFTIWGALLNGAELRLLDKNTLLDTNKFSQEIIHAAINIIFLTTRLFDVHTKNNLKIFSNLKYLLFGGENADRAQVKSVADFAKPAHFIHCYGPTENTVFTTTYEILNSAELTDTVPIGKPISGTEIYIVDKFNNLMPSDVPGEILIGGIGLSAGYIANNSENQKFISIPNFPLKINSHHFYKTGDLAKWSFSGNIEFLGRIDLMVKIRGHRVEPEYVENVIRSFSEVSNCYVKYDATKKMLIAFVETTPPTNSVDIQEMLKLKLKKLLPDYMMPSKIISLCKMPLNIQGKTARENLKEDG